ncbi:hypothetical protein GCM10009114_19350 [Aliiglaciecola litoralis]|uniref:RHS repeat-associated core domain-containing protein n=2 Tax=Aliiglaciecola litoralis TaxID=582857 RepID=A0ABN1LJJ8_9ALTE
MDSIDVSKGSLLHYLDISHDDRGNVTSRRSNYASSTGIGSDFTETYTYDALYRLKTRTIGVASGSSALPADFKATQTYNYDNWGNFTYKTGAGYYKYDATKVHKLLGVYTNSNFTGTKYTFDYDDNGNVKTDGTRVFTYASFDKPTRITKGSATSDMKYGVDRELYYKDDNSVENGSNVRYRRYYIGAYEKVVRTGGNGNMTEHKYNIGNAILTYRSGSNTISFVHKDNQGSVISTTNHLGQVTTQDIYDPFGKQSEVYRSSVYLTTYPPITDKGYTGHKQMNHVDIIHMGGRIYDPTLGRFLQADPHIQAPKNSQSYNRYSYVLNNPMSYTDPSGYFFDKLFKSINNALGKFAPFVAAALMFIPGVGQWAAASMWNAAAVGFVSGGIATGSLKGALIGAFTGAVFQQIGAHYRGLSAQNVDNVAWGGGQLGDYVDFGGNLLTKGQAAGQIASHAIAGGVISTLSGGKFGHGFFSAGVTKGIGGAYLPSGSNLSSGEIAKGTVVSAVIGGTASVISGGKFANGARTAAYQFLFNQAGKSAIEKVTKRISIRVFKSGRSVTSERPVGKAQWVGLQAAGPIVDKLAKLPSHLTLGINLELLTQEYGIYELYEVYEVEHTYRVTHNGPYDFDYDLIDVGAQIPTGETSWIYTGLSTGFSIEDIRGCIFSCNGIDRGAFGNGVD